MYKCPKDHWTCGELDWRQFGIMHNVNQITSHVEELKTDDELVSNFTFLNTLVFQGMQDITLCNQEVVH